MNYKQMLDKFQELEDKIEFLELKIALLEQQVQPPQPVVVTPMNPFNPPWRVTSDSKAHPLQYGDH